MVPTSPLAGLTEPDVTECNDIRPASHWGRGLALRGAKQHPGNLLVQPHFSLLLHSHGVGGQFL